MSFASGCVRWYTPTGTGAGPTPKAEAGTAVAGGLGGAAEEPGAEDAGPDGDGAGTTTSRVGPS